MVLSRGTRRLLRVGVGGGVLFLFLALFLLVGLALLHAPAQASITTLTVTTTGDDASPAACSGTSCATLRDAVNAANAMTSSSGSPIEIDLPAGTVTLTNGVIDLGSTSNIFLTIKGHGPTPGDSVVNQATAGSGVFETPILNNLTTNFQSLTISGGHAGGFGGGALQTGSTGDVATFTNCVLTNNTATFGGAVLMSGGNLAISGSTFVSNTATSGAGGAVDFVATSAPGNLTINNTTFSQNAATAGTGTTAKGGAVSVTGPMASLAITGSTFDSNAAGSPAGGQGQGGALATTGETSGSITLSGFTNNAARTGNPTLVPPVNLDNRGIGGAIYNDSGALTVSDSRFAGNAATEGAAIEQDTSAGSVTANDNWWGSDAAPGPAVSANSARTVLTRGPVPATTTRLQLRAGASPAAIAPGGTAIVTADLYGRVGTFTTPLPAGALNGLAPFPAPGGSVFSNAVHGSLSGAGTQFVNGKASATFTGGTFLGPGGADATADSQVATAAVTVTADAVVTLGSSSNPSVLGQPVTFTATIASGVALTTPAGALGGTVQFRVDGGNVGGPVPVVAGAATSASVTNLGVGTHTVAAAFSGDADFNAGTGTLAGGEVVNKAGATVAVGSSSNPSVAGQGLTFSATVTALAPGAGLPTGTVQFKDNGVAIGGPQALNGSGVATVAAGALGVGTHVITATYGGNAGFLPATGALVPSQVVNRAPTTLSIASSANPSVTGQGVTFTATPASSLPGLITGNVTFAVDGVARGAPVALSGGSASLTGVADLAVGTHTVTATFGGDATYAGSDGTLAGGQAVGKAGTATAIGSSPNPSLASLAVGFTATVTATPPGAGTPTGQVQFSADGAAIGGLVGLSGGVATLPGVTSLSIDTHAVTATYLGDAGFTGSISAPLVQVVHGYPTTAIVTSSIDPSVAGQPVSFTATVDAATHGTPDGTVQFGVDGTNIGGPVALSGGSAHSVAVSDLGVGAHTVTATYSGSVNFAPSAGALPGGQTVAKADTTLGIASSHTPTVFGQPVTFTATVGPLAPGAGGPSGQVQFGVDGVDIGSPVSLSGGSAVSAPIAILSAGTHAVTATYAGDASFNPSTGSLSGGQVVDQAPVGVIVGSSVNPSVVGQSVAFHATVAAVAPGAGTPSGMVSFFVDGAHLGDAPLVSGVSTASGVSSLAIGSHTVTATYAGDANFLAGTSTALTQTVSLAATTVTLASARTPSVYGQPVTFTATVGVLSPGSGQPAGTVAFSADGTPFGTASLVGTAAVSPPIATLGAGSHTVTATYLGAANFGASTGSTTQVVSPAGTSLAVSSGPNPSVFGQTVSVSATVTTVAPGSGTPTGTVQFLDGTTPLGSPVALAAGTASLADAALAPGTHTISANFLGGTNFLPAGGAASQTVNVASTSARAGSSRNPVPFGQPVSFTATVAPVPPGAGTPTGQVQFFLDGATFGGPVTLSAGAASSATTSLSPGPHPVTVTYTGDNDFAAAVSSPMVQVVGQIDATLNVTSTVTSAAFGQPVTFSATVTGTAGIPTGVIQFGVDGVDLGGPVPLSAGVATSVATSTLPVGVHTVTATYGGSITYKSTTAGLTQTVVKADTTATLTSSANPSVFGQAVQFTATVAAVAPGVGTPGGQVQFLIDGSDFGAPAALAGGVATSASTGALDLGPHTVQYQYLGDAGFNPTSGSLAGSQLVNRSDTATSLTTSHSPSAFGEAVQFTAQVAAVGGGAGAPDGSVQFVVDGAAVGPPVALSGGSATSPPFGSLTVGAHTVRADYAGSARFNASSGSLTGEQVVQKAATTTVVRSSENPAIVGDTVVFTATVDPPAATPSGVVRFFVDGSQAGPPVTLGGGVASFATSSLGVGNHSVVASYDGNSGFQPSSGSLAGGQTVAVPATADLAAAQTGPAAALPGGIATYVIVAANNGPADATDVVLTESLPAGWLAAGILPTRGTCQTGNGKVTCTIGSLPAGAQAVVTLVLIPHGIGTMTLTASVSGDQPDANLVNNSASVQTQVQQLGYWLFASDGGVFTFGDAGFFGSTGSMQLNRPVVSMRPTPTREGYWLFASDGGVFAFGDAGFFGSTASLRLNAPIVAMAATPDGRGYWLFGGDGGVFAFGDAGFFGSTGGQRLAAPVVGMAATPDGKGYWLVGADGSVFGFGSAGSFGSLAGQRLTTTIVGMAATPDGKGYWLVGANGSVYGFGDADSFGSLVGSRLNAPVVAIAPTPAGRGYWLVASDGGVFGFGDAPFLGGMGGQHLNRRIVGLAAGG